MVSVAYDRYESMSDAPSYWLTAQMSSQWPSDLQPQHQQQQHSAHHQHQNESQSEEYIVPYYHSSGGGARAVPRTSSVLGYNYNSHEVEQRQLPPHSVQGWHSTEYLGAGHSPTELQISHHPRVLMSPAESAVSGDEALTYFSGNAPGSTHLGNPSMMASSLEYDHGGSFPLSPSPSHSSVSHARSTVSHSRGPPAIGDARADWLESTYLSPTSHVVDAERQRERDSAPAVGTESQEEAEEEAEAEYAMTDADSDYNPSGAASSRSRRKSSRRAGKSSGVRSKVRKQRGSMRRGSSATSLASLGHSSARSTGLTARPINRPFMCPLSPYGCPKTFATKNEWKRHIVVQHLNLEYWSCDLCPNARKGPNNFNRKDLFTQHLRRMHEQQGGTQEHECERIRERCHVKVRDAPAQTYCVVCGPESTRHASIGDWLEHVGRHLASLSPERRAQIAWDEDTTLRTWLLQQGLLQTSSDASGSFVLTAAAGVAYDQINSDNEDAEGEPE